MKIADGVEMLELSMEVFGKINSVCPVLITERDEIMLVDTGYPGQLEQVRSAMEQSGFPFRHISRIIITHHDLDHIGCLAGIVDELQGKAEVIAHEAEKPYIQGDIVPIKLAQMESRLETLNDQMRGLYEGMKRGYRLSVSKVDKTVADSELIPYSGGIEVIYTPGHTIGHMSLYIRACKTLISGDTLFVEENKLVPAPAFSNFDNELAKASIKKLTGFDIENVICYHGGSFRDDPNCRIAEIAEEIGRV